MLQWIFVVIVESFTVFVFFLNLYGTFEIISLMISLGKGHRDLNVERRIRDVNFEEFHCKKV